MSRGKRTVKGLAPAWLAPLIIGLAAAFLRLWQHDLTPFLDDEARLLAAAHQILTSGQIPLTSGFPTSIHINEPPLAAALAAIPIAISRDAVWVSGVLATLDAFAAVFVFFAAKQVAGGFAGVAAGSLYAVAPAAIYFSRRIYYSEAEPFFVALALLMCVRAWKWRSPHALGMALVAAVCATELHATAAGVLVLWVVTAIATAGKLTSYRPVVLGAVIALLTIAPYLYLQILTHGGDIQAAMAFAGQAKQSDLSGPEIAASLIGGGVYQQQLLPRGASIPTLALDPIGWLLIALMLAGAFAVWRHRAAWPALVLLAAEVLLTLRHAGAVLPYYELAVLPAAALLAGISLASIRPRFLGMFALAVPLLWQTAGYMRFQAQVAADAPALEYGMPLRYEEAAAQALPTLSAGSRVHFAQAGNQQFSFGYLTGDRYLGSNSDSHYGVALPSSSSAYYIVQADGPPYDFLERVAGSPTDVIRTTSGKPVFGAFSVPATASDAYESLPGFQPVQADIGGAVRISGYAADALAAGKPSQIAIVWKVLNPNLPLPSDVQQFAHLVDGHGKTWSTDADERAYPTSSWQAGDMVITWFDLAPPPETPTGGYWLETGFYGYPGAEPLGRMLRVGPMRVGGRSPSLPSTPKALFGNELALLDARVQDDTLTLTWQALRQPSAGYTVFVHALDSFGELVAQDDSVPQAGAFPTTLWRAGDVVRDVHVLPEPARARSSLEIGLYTRPDLRRLNTSDGSDRVVLPVG